MEQQAKGLIDKNINLKQKFKIKEDELSQQMHLDYDQMIKIFNWPNGYLDNTKTEPNSFSAPTKGQGARGPIQFSSHQVVKSDNLLAQNSAKQSVVELDNQIKSLRVNVSIKQI